MRVLFASIIYTVLLAPSLHSLHSQAARLALARYTCILYTSTQYVLNCTQYRNTDHWVGHGLLRDRSGSLLNITFIMCSKARTKATMFFLLVKWTNGNNWIHLLRCLSGNIRTAPFDPNGWHKTKPIKEHYLINLLWCHNKDGRNGCNGRTDVEDKEWFDIGSTTSR